MIAKHSGERFECKSCGKKFTLNESLRRHVKEVHGNQIFPCPECDFVGRRQDSLNYHLQWKHCEMKSTCDECGYEAETVRLIQRHKLRVHRGVKYPCDKCDYVTADKSSLSYHMKSKHEKIRFQCDLKGVTAKMQMAKLSFCHFLASGHLIFKILVPTPVVNRELWGVGTRIMKIKCSEVKKWQKQSLAICIFAVTPFMYQEIH